MRTPARQAGVVVCCCGGGGGGTVNRQTVIQCVAAHGGCFGSLPIRSKKMELPKKQEGQPPQPLSTVIIVASAMDLVMGAYIPAQSLFGITFGPLGFILISIVYVGFTLGCFFAPALCRLFSDRIVFMIASFGYNVFIIIAALAASFSHVVPWLFPAAFVCGLGSALMWTKLGDYISCCAGAHFLGRYNAIAMSIVFSCTIWVNLLGVIVLSVLEGSEQVFYGILAAISVSATCVYMFVRPVTTKLAAERCSFKSLGIGKVFSTLVHPYFAQGLVGLILWSGVSKSFFMGGSCRPSVSAIVHALHVCYDFAMLSNIFPN